MAEPIPEQNRAEKELEAVKPPESSESGEAASKRLSPLPQREEAPRILGTNSAYVAFTAVANLFVFWLIERSSLATPGAEEAILRAGAAGSGALSLILFGTLWYERGRTVLQDLKELSFSLTVSLLLALTIGVGAAAFAYLVDFQVALQLRLAESAAGILALIAVWLYGYERLLAAYRQPIVPVESGHRTDSTGKPVSARVDLREGEEIVLDQSTLIEGDALILKGSALVDECRFGTAPVTRLLGPGEPIPAGSVVREGRVRLSGLASSENSETSLFTDTLRTNIEQSEGINESGQERLGWAVFTSWFLAVSAAIYWWQAEQDPYQAGFAALSLIFLGLLAESVRSLIFVPQFVMRRLFRHGCLVRSREKIAHAGRIKELICLLRESERDWTRMTAESLEIIDERVDREKLYSVLLALSGAGQNEVLEAVGRFARENGDALSNLQVDKIEALNEAGVIKVIEGMTFVLGNEEFLLNVGVNMQPNEIVPADPEGLRECWYLSSGPELVARISIVKRACFRDPSTVRELREFGVRPQLWGYGVDQGMVDRIGKEASFELSDIKRFDSEQEIADQAAHKEDVILVHSPHETASLPIFPPDSPPLTVTWFDPVLWNLRSADLLLHSEGLDPLYKNLRLARTAVLTGRLAKGLLSGLAVVHVALSFLFVSPPFLTILSIFIASVGVYLAFLPLVPDPRRL